MRRFDKDFDQALELGWPALLRIQAEVLLDRIDDPGERQPFTITEEQREELNRIASEPNPNDEVYLGQFDYIYESDIHDEGDD